MTGTVVDVSLTFDDALPEHLDIVAPRLEERGLRGTFYVHLSAAGFASRLDDWRELARRGHELGNHTILHPATRAKEWVPSGARIEDYSLDRMALEIDAANRILSGLDGRTERTFAYPCGASMVGRPGPAKRALVRAGLDRTRLMGWLHRWPWLDIGSRETDYAPILEGRVMAARAGGGPDGAGVQTPPRYRIPCVSGDRKDGDGLIADVRTRLDDGGWLVLGFHGVGGGHGLGTSLPAFEALVDLLAGRDDVRVRPVVDVARDLWRTA